MSAHDFLRLIQLLNGAGVEFVIVGGTAAVLHGSSMATYDLDVLMPFTEENCGRLLRALADQHPRLSHTPDKRPLSLPAAELARFKNVYLATDAGRLDVLGSLPPLVEVEEVFRRAEWIDLEGIRVRIISLEQLIEVKAATGRPKDKLMATELRAISDKVKGGGRGTS